MSVRSRMQVGESCAVRRSVAPGAVHVQEHEQVSGAVAPVLAVVALDLPRRGRDRLAHLADELRRALVEADYRAFRIWRFGVEIEHILHAGNVIGIDLGNAPHVPEPWLEMVVARRPRTGSRDTLSCA